MTGASLSFLTFRYTEPVSSFSSSLNSSLLRRHSGIIQNGASHSLPFKMFRAQSKALQELHKEFGPFHFSVLAFPCNQFGESEPRPSKEVLSFARNNYGVTFPIFHKIKILGSEAEPAFRFLVDSSKKEPRWNFWKYLVNPEGQVVKYWRPEEPIEVIRPEIAALIRQMIIKKKEDL
ncbi:probable glutathione peroxidase 8 isoform X2 [Phacochoerus africanus]|uniref:probable glutathione peroxidase 8 isoform X2 n=1 Tax=Phacochoerus africanus TaxID=41426 RepID=UPI001FD8C75E|nr:probable glutathione peroxidase 8 isoform X2 [Phacochoerus africanus]